VTKRPREKAELASLDDPRSLSNQALTTSAKGDQCAALALLKQQERMCRESGDAAGLQVSLDNQALIGREIDRMDANSERYLSQLFGNEETSKARTAFQEAIESGYVGYTPRAAVYLGEILADQGDLAKATAVFRQVIDSGDAESAPQACFKLGLLLKGRGDVAGARTAFQQAIDSDHSDYASRARVAMDNLSK
jgi:TolA-binding protein